MAGLARWIVTPALIIFIAVVATARLAAAGSAGDGGPIIELSPQQSGIKGIVGHWWYLDANLSRFVDAYADLGVTTVRLTTDWRQIEPEEGRRDFARTDRLFGTLLGRGIEPVPVFATIPAWASLNPDDCRADELACQPDPAKLEAFAATAAQIVGRYPRITRWEFWNEPEMWPGMRDPAVHQVWYLAFYQAAKRANPSARIALGTLTGWEFVNRLDPNLPFDAVTMHSFEDERGDPIYTSRLEQLHDELAARGRGVPLWLTEYGWDSRWLNDRGRAETIRWVFDWLRAHPFVELAHYHMLHDTADPQTCCFGLLGPPPDFEPKRLAYDAFRAYVVRR
ncbi:MAG TPA: hypothetical protein VEQ11_16080 [Chloroflexota bacterium]|nr:hypothetical protein [Chloroflexota bacterium]